MKCKVFKIHLENDFDETKLNSFLETVNPQQVFASIVGGETHFWTVLVLYEEKNSGTATETPRRSEKSDAAQNVNIVASETIKSPIPKRESTPVALTPEPAKLTAEQENSYNALRSWRNERASRDGVPPYLIAHNDSLMQMAAMTIKSPEDLLQVKGLGEKRVEKYGDEILRILSSIES